tara:strand:- start:195 stop:521 length:327 start_codon:yes stop_codon:yes gene_type:complete
MKNLILNESVKNLFLNGGTLVKSCISSDENFFVGVVKMQKDNLAKDTIYKTNREFNFAIISNYKYNNEIFITSLENNHLTKVKNNCNEQYKEDISTYRKKTKSLEYIY